jgi:uncharacterized protein
MKSFLNGDNMVDEKDSASGCFSAKNCNIVTDEKKMKPFVPKNSVMIVGFLGPGLVGNIVTNEIVEQLKLEQIGYVITEDLPAIAVFHDGILVHPFRLYYSAQYSMIIALCEIPFNKSDTYSNLSRLLIDWVNKVGIKEICVIQGLAVENPIVETYPVYIAAEKEILTRIKKKGALDILPRGLIMGPEAAMLNESLNNKVEAYALLAPVIPQIPDANAAVAILEKLNKLYGININTKKLKDEGEEVSKKLMELSMKTQEQHQDMVSLGKNPNSDAPMYL